MPITELVEVKVKENISDQNFMKAADELVKNCFMNTDGFIDSEMFKVNDGNWKFIYHWESMKHFEAAGQSMMKSNEVANIKEMAAETKISTFEQILKWES